MLWLHQKKQKENALGGNSASRIRLAAAEDELIFGEAVKKYRNRQIDEELLKYPHVLLRLAEADT